MPQYIIFQHDNEIGADSAITWTEPHWKIMRRSDKNGSKILISTSQLQYVNLITRVWLPFFKPILQTDLICNSWYLVFLLLSNLKMPNTKIDKKM